MYAFDCISDFIFVENKVEPADIILVSGGSVPTLMERAAELYNQGLAPYILPSGGANVKISGYATEWEYLREIGIINGVPQEVILKEDKARHTFENAELSLKVLNERCIKISRAILVCKAYHSRRALLTYKTAFSENVEFFISTVADRRNTQKDNWFLDGERISLVMGEVTKIGQYFQQEIPKWVRVDNNAL